MDELKGTLFHFTGTFENLVGILTSDFHPRYCLEGTADWLGGDDDSMSYALPMVCFCDLKLSQLGNHMATYGNYGIGLTKEWGRKRGVSPIFYLNRASRTVGLISELLAAYTVQDSDGGKQPSPFVHAISELFGYVKPYEGNMYRDGKYVMTRFYDEREWRYIPESYEKRGIEHLPFRMNKDGFQNELARAVFNKKAGELDQLHFEPVDIRYLLVKSEHEVLPLVSAIATIKERFGRDQVVRLTTRILVSEHAGLDY